MLRIKPSMTSVVASWLGMFIMLLIPGLSESARDSSGLEFVFAFGDNSATNGVGDEYLEVFVTTREPGPVNFNYTSSGAILSGSISAGQIFSYTLPVSERMSETYTTTVEPKGQIVMSDDAIVVYASNKALQSCDGFTALPTDILGTEHYVIGWENSGSYAASMIVITAIEDNTEIFISHDGNVLVSNVTINRGEAFQYLSKDTPMDITGAFVSANKKISVSSGNRRTLIGAGRSSDHLVEMVPPVETLGKTFFTLNLVERDQGVFKLMGAEAGMTCTVTNSDTGTNTYNFADAGDFVTLNTNRDELLSIACSGKAICAQFSSTSGEDGALSDPMMSLLIPVEQYEAGYVFATPSGVSDSYRHYANLVIETAHRDGLRLDGAPVLNTMDNLGFNIGDYVDESCWVEDSWIEIPGSAYSTRTLAVLEGSHTLDHVNGPQVFYAGLYGQVEYESYGFPAGSRYIDFDAVTTTNLPTTTTAESTTTPKPTTTATPKPTTTTTAEPATTTLKPTTDLLTTVVALIVQPPGGQEEKDVTEKTNTAIVVGFVVPLFLAAVIAAALCAALIIAARKRRRQVIKDEEVVITPLGPIRKIALIPAAKPAMASSAGSLNILKVPARKVKLIPNPTSASMSTPLSVFGKFKRASRKVKLLPDIASQDKLGSSVTPPRTPASTVSAPPATTKLIKVQSAHRKIKLLPTASSPAKP